jgi:hypothetical protein
MLDKVKAMLQEYITEGRNIINSNSDSDSDSVGNKNRDKIEKQLENMKYVTEILMMTNLKKLHEGILKYIAPSFNLDITRN